MGNQTSGRIARFGGVAKILGGLEANYSKPAPKVMYYSARGPDPEDASLSDADIMKPNLIAPGNLIWGAWSSLGTDSAEFEGKFLQIQPLVRHCLLPLSLGEKTRLTSMFPGYH